MVFFNKLRSLNKIAEDTFVSTSTWESFLWWHCVPLLYYTHTNKRTKMMFLPSLIQVSMMMLGQMRETHTQMEYQCSSLYCSISISATECYNFISKELIDTVILYSQMCKRKCNITALFLRAPNVRRGLISMEIQYKHNTPTLKERL